MSLLEKINGDIKASMLAREKDKLEALRAVKSALLLLATQEGSSGTITEDEELKLLQKLVKQRKEAAEVYQGQGRADLAEVEQQQAAVIEGYLPAQLSAREIESALREIIAQTGASSPKDMGKVMGLASARFAGKADNKIVAGIVRTLLGA